MSRLKALYEKDLKQFKDMLEMKDFKYLPKEELMENIYILEEKIKEFDGSGGSYLVEFRPYR